MSDKAEAAQKWAEAKVRLDAAEAALTAARDAYAKAEDAEFHAWQALESLAGRVTATPIATEVAAGTTITWSGELAHKEPLAHRHSLPSRPIG